MMPTLRDARLRIWAVINDNGLSLPRKVTIGQRDSYLPASDRHQNRYVELAVSPLS
ncbi:putative DNA-binding transcriptional regulator AlpA [Mycobacterium sp. OAE908]